jgi:hypothetical protein
MSWRYEQSTGKLWRLEAVGYSGREEALNQPDLEAVMHRGPIPRGIWKLAGTYDSERRGPLCIRLEPQGFDPHGRSAFLIHGDLVHGPPFSASEGCIILPRTVREKVWESGDRILEVVR